MEPYIDLFLTRSIWVIMGFFVFIGAGYFLTKDETSYSWEKNTNWPKYLLGLISLAYAIVLVYKWGFFPFLYWFGVVHVTLMVSILTYIGISAGLTAETIPAEDWLDASSVRFKEMDTLAHVLTIGLGLLIFALINLIGIHLAL